MLSPDNSWNLTILSAIAELVSLRFEAQNTDPKRSEALKQNTEFLMFIQLSTLKHVEIPMLKALVEMYPYVIAIEYHIVQRTKYILKGQKRSN